MKTMNEKVLVCYGSRHGSTAEISERISETLRGHGAEVDLVDLKKEKAKGIKDYDIVVIGSGIQMGKWTKEALKFIKKHRDILAQKKVAIFVSCLSAAQPDKCNTARREYLENIDESFPEINPISRGLFGGLIDTTRGNFVTRTVMQALVKSLVEDDEVPPERIDLRDWEQIRLWAEELLRYPYDL